MFKNLLPIVLIIFCSHTLAATLEANTYRCVSALNQTLANSSFKRLREYRLVVGEYEFSDDRSKLYIRLVRPIKNEFGHRAVFANVVYNVGNHVLEDITADPDEPIIIKYDANKSKLIEKSCINKINGVSPRRAHLLAMRHM